MSRGLALLLLLLVLVAPLAAENRRETVEQHALAAPPAAEASLDKLAAWLAKGCQSQEERARAIFRWITDRISYDVEGFLSGNYPNPDPENVLRTRSAVCAGYAQLFVALAERCGLEAELVAGNSKGYGFSADREMSRRQADHAWNVVKIDGHWRLVDATWGAGAVDGERKFLKRYNEHWFATRPEQFIYDHFPSEARWQLLTRPLSRQEFLSLVKVTSSFFRHGLQARSHPNAVIRAAGSVEVRLDSPANVLVMAELLKNGRAPTRPLTFVQRQGPEQLIRVMLPDRGSYQLRIYARDSESQGGAYEQVMDYQVEATSGRSPCPGYPRTFGSFQARGAFLVSPLLGRLKAGGSEEFRLRLKDAEAVMVGDDSRQVPLARSGSTFSGRVRLQPGTVRVYARFPGQANYTGLLEYTVL